MQEVEKLISLYHTGYVISLGLAIFFFLCAGFVFFKFNIPRIFAVRTGRAVRKTIRHVEEINAMTGQLKYPEELENDAEKVRHDVVITPATSVKKVETGSLSKKLFGRDTSGKLKLEKKPEKIYPIKFKIEKEQIFIHTEEII